MTKEHHDKKWTALQADSSWSILKIASEFVAGYDTMNKIGPCVSIYGSARTQPDNKYYKMAVKIAELCVDAGYGVITGGGPGIMEAANKGAQAAEGRSVGLDIDLPFEGEHNKYIDSDKLIRHNYFFVRKVMFVKYGQAFIFLPGGFGTLDELFECLTLIQTKKITRVPIVLLGIGFWSGLLHWVEEVLLEGEKNISRKDLDLYKITDSEEDAIEYINAYYEDSELSPNFYT